MKNWIPKKNLIIFAVGTAVLSALLYFGGLSFVLYQIQKIRNSYSDAESASSKDDRARDLKVIAETNKEEISILRGFFIKKGDEVKFIEDIENLGKESNVEFKIDSIDVAPGQADVFKEDVIVKVYFEGNWQSVMKFVYGLERLQFGVMTKNLSLEAQSKGVWSGSIQFIVFREK